MTHIAILSNPMDIHAHAVHEILERKGVKTTLFYATDFPTKLYLTIKNGSKQSFPFYRAEGKAGCHDTYTAVWLRRPNQPVIPDFIEEEDREKAKLESKTMRDGYFQLFAPKAFWVNRMVAANLAENKVTQQHTALNAGLTIPDTLFSNDPKEIKSFIRSYDKVIYKTLTAQMLPTTVITENELPEDEVLCTTPGIFQPLVEKKYELRVTVIGNHFFPAKINSQGTTLGETDWRKDHGKYEVTFEPVKLPKKIEQQCLRLMDDLGVVYGSIDFIVTPEEDYIFLEINQSGQFLFLEEMMKDPWPLGDAMAEMLLQGRPDFRWEQNGQCIWFDEKMKKVAKERLKMSREKHQIPLPV